jgi:acetyl-CoA carboxylase biotin carboxyl carrier protein
VGGVKLDSIEIIELIRTINESSINEFELSNGANYIRMSKNIKDKEYTEKVILEKPISREEPSISQETDTPKENQVIENAKVIKSPIVGTFYTSNGNVEEPFVRIGDKVKKGDVLCIIEAMKIMNEITSNYDGEIVEILVEDGNMVEFEEEIFKIV